MRGKSQTKDLNTKKTGDSIHQVCNSLYLTQPGKLWNNHSELSDGVAFEQKVLSEVNKNLAIHTPNKTTTPLHTWRTWGMWVDGYAFTGKQHISSQMRVEWQSSSETCANTKTDSILDEYIKTCEVPLSGKQYKVQLFQEQTSLKHVKDRVRIHYDTSSKRRSSSSSQTEHQPEHQSPFSVYKNAQMYKKKVSQIDKKHNTKQFHTPPPTYTTPVISTNFDCVAQPLRLKPLQHSSMQTSLCVSHPWYQATSLWERLEVFLEDQYIKRSKQAMKIAEYKTLIQTITHIVRTIITRGRSVMDFQDHCQDSLDLLDVAPSLQNFMKRNDYVYTTSKTLLTDLMSSVQMLFGPSEKHMNIIMMFIQSYEPQWAYEPQLYKKDTINHFDVALLHTLVSNIQASHSNENTRKKYVASVMPKNTPEHVITLYSNRYEQIVRAQYMSETAFRNEQNILTTAYSLLQLPKPSVLQHIQKNNRRGRAPTKLPSTCQPHVL